MPGGGELVELGAGIGRLLACFSLAITGRLMEGVRPTFRFFLIL